MARKIYKLPHAPEIHTNGHPAMMPGKRNAYGNGKSRGGYGTRFGSPPRNRIVYCSDFSRGEDGWSAAGAIGGALTGNTDSIGGLDDVLKFETGSSLGVHTAVRVIFPADFTNSGEYTVGFKYYIPSTNTNTDSIYVAFGASSTAYYSATQDTWLNGSLAFEQGSFGTLTFYSAQDGAALSGTLYTPTAGDLLYLRDIEIRRSN